MQLLFVNIVCYFNLFKMSRELENRLEKQRATQRYIEEFKKKREDVRYLVEFSNILFKILIFGCLDEAILHSVDVVTSLFQYNFLIL